jgi:hypothetical protein
MRGGIFQPRRKMWLAWKGIHRTIHRFIVASQIYFRSHIVPLAFLGSEETSRVAAMRRGEWSMKRVQAALTGVSIMSFTPLQAFEAVALSLVSG